MAIVKSKLPSFDITLRVLIALLGGYLLANLIAILISYFPQNNKVDAIVAGLMVSFIIYTIAVMFVFAVKTIRTAALGVFGSCTVVFGIISYLTMANA